ncbi:hypothetical protein [Telmatospirillum siberiense]|uniref:hypothetical protein n=1 Tax=Telmatospirillum siberiense TaxID=382514 RepID=UPI00130408BB|nr:hypothetical protein [Telmatospirillum siberiense]
MLPKAPVDIEWQRDERGYYYRLLRLRPAEAGLTGVGGVYVLWTRGIHPKWIYVGATDNLGAAIGQARDTQEILAFEGRSSVYVTWSPIRPEYRDGVALHLRNTLTPELGQVFPTDHLKANETAIAVLPPG